MKHLLIIVALSASFVGCMGTDADNGSAKLTLDQKKKLLSDSLSMTTIEWKDAVPGTESDTLKSMIQRDDAFVDLGKVKKGSKVEVSFPFTNSGKHPLVIQSVEPGCGCTLAQGKPEKPIAPGASETIKVTYDTQNQALGEQNKHVVVRAANTLPSNSFNLSFRVEVVE